MDDSQQETFDESTNLTNSTMMNSIVTPNIGDHFIQLLKLSGCSESLLPDIDYINNFFTENNSDEFTRFLFTLGPKNFVSEEERQRANLVTENDEEVEKYLEEKLGDQSNKIPITQQSIDKLEDQFTEIQAKYAKDQDFFEYLRKESKEQDLKIKNLKDAVKTTEDNIASNLNIAKVKIEEHFSNLEKAINNFAHNQIKGGNEVSCNETDTNYNKLLENQAKIFEIFKIVYSIWIKGKNDRDEFIKILLLKSGSLNSVNPSILEEFESNTNQLEIILSNWCSTILRWIFVYKIVIAINENKILNYFPIVISTLKENILTINNLLDNLISNIPQIDSDNFKEELKNLNLILNNSSSPNGDQILESLNQLVINDEEILGNKMEQFTSTFSCAINSLEKVLTHVNIDEESLKNFVEKGNEVKKLILLTDKAEEKRSLMEELLLLTISDSEEMLTKLKQLEDKVKLLELAVN